MLLPMESKKNEGSGYCEVGKSADCRAKLFGHAYYVDLHFHSSPFYSGESEL